MNFPKYKRGDAISVMMHHTQNWREGKIVQDSGGPNCVALVEVEPSVRVRFRCAKRINLGNEWYLRAKKRIR